MCVKRIEKKTFQEKKVYVKPIGKSFCGPLFNVWKLFFPGKFFWILLFCVKPSEKYIYFLNSSENPNETFFLQENFILFEWIFCSFFFLYMSNQVKEHFRRKTKFNEWNRVKNVSGEIYFSFFVRLIKWLSFVLAH